MPSLPSIEILDMKYAAGPKEDVAALIGGTVEANINDPKYTAYKDTCAIRVSRALNYAGDPIPPAGGGVDNPYVAGKVRTDKGGDGKFYIYSTYDMRAYLNTRYGKAKKFPPTATSADVKDLKGIIAFGFLHIDLWDGEKCSRKCYFGDKRILNDNILVWPTGSVLDSRK